MARMAAGSRRIAISKWVTVAIIVIIVAVAGVIIGYTVTAPSQSTTSTTSTASLVDLARQEGSLSLVGGPPQAFWNATTLAFENAYPFLKVSFSLQPAGSLGSTVDSQERAGSVTYDVAVIPAPSPQYLGFLNSSYLVPYDSPSFSKYNWSSQFIGPNFTSFAAGATVGSAWVYNINTVPANMVPHSWADIWNNASFWGNGQFGMNNPALGGGTWFTYYHTIWEPYGITGFQKLATLKPYLGSTVAEYAAKAAAGQLRGGYTWDSYNFALMKSGAPINVVYPSNPVLNTWQAAILKGAPHPNAAKLFIDWLASPPAQHVVVEQGTVWSAMIQNETPYPGLTNIWQLHYVTFTSSQQQEIYAQFSKSGALGQIETALGIS